MQIHMTGDCIPAALHLIAQTSLANLPDAALSVTLGDPLTIRVSDEWGWSSGERYVLLPLLASLGLADRAHDSFLVPNLKTVDPKTAAACVEAITIAAGFGSAVPGDVAHA